MVGDVLKAVGVVALLLTFLILGAWFVYVLLKAPLTAWDRFSSTGDALWFICAVGSTYIALKVLAGIAEEVLEIIDEKEGEG